MKTNVITTLFSLVIGLSACAPVQVEEPPPPARVAEVRSEAAAVDSVIHVEPLTAPEVTVLLRQAGDAVAAEDFIAARELIDEALSLAPDDPRVWQRRAELELADGAYAAAIDAARQSFDLGPRVGELCSRNWLTIAQAQEALGNGEAADNARDRGDACPVKARERI